MKIELSTTDKGSYWVGGTYHIRPSDWAFWGKVMVYEVSDDEIPDREEYRAYLVQNGVKVVDDDEYSKASILSNGSEDGK